MAENNKHKLKIPYIGLFAVKNSMITKEDLQKALYHCATAKDPQSALKKYFLSEKLISKHNMVRLLKMEEAFEIRQLDLRFGAIAIRKGVINKSVLKLALEEQEKDIKAGRQPPRLIGDLLVEAGMLSPSQRDDILILQKRLRQSTKIILHDQEDEIVPVINKDKSGDLLKPEVISGGIKLEISRDFMSAFLTKTEFFDMNITLEHVRESLADHGVVSGVVNNDVIKDFILSNRFKTESFRVAQGIFPLKGHDARIEFFFNSDYLRADGLQPDGSIDLTDRGEIHYVEAGTVLAEKIPMIEPKCGCTVLGGSIEMLPAKDIKLKSGNGAKISEDGFKVIATTSGFPKYSLSGRIFVHGEYINEGDVDYRTGHINYEGNINIKGRIKSGFKVEGNDIKAIEINGGILKAKGDIMIADGISGAEIYARGNVYAKFIHASKILCMGSVVVQKKIKDSDIDCSGSCSIEKGELISSRISAKMGVMAGNIGVDMEDPNIVEVGHDVFCEKELKNNKGWVEKLEKLLEDYGKEKARLKQEDQAIQKQISKLARIQDRSQLEAKHVLSKIRSVDGYAESLDAMDRLKEMDELKNKVEQLKRRAQDAERNLNSFFNKSDGLGLKLKELDLKIFKLKKKYDDLVDEKHNLIAWSRNNQGNPGVVVDKVLMPGTVIAGMYSEKKTTELMRHVKITEVLSINDDGNKIYEMKVAGI